MKYRALIFAIIAFGLSTPAAAYLPHGSAGVSATCPQSIDNGCAAANQSAQVIFPNYFTTVRQSGQAQYKAAGGTPSNHPPTFNVPGVDYPVGQITPDVSLIDPLTIMGTGDFTGCSYSAASHTVTCGSATHNFSGYRWNGIGLSSSGAMTFSNNHQTMNGDNCRNYAGNGVIINSGNLDNIVTNNTVDFTNECAFNAQLYKSANDPGLATQASFTAAIVSNAMTISSNATGGKVRVAQYMDFPGRSAETTISSLTSPTPVTISSITISGNIATVTTATPHGMGVGMGIRMDNQTATGYRGDAEVLSVPTSTSFTYQIPYYQTLPTVSATAVGTYSIRYCSGASCNGTTWAVSGTANAASGAFTTGPMTPAFNGTLALTAANITAKYNAIFGLGQFISHTSTGNVYEAFNYEEINQFDLQHVNFNFNTPVAGVTQDIIFEGNNIWWNPNVKLGAGTGTLDLFTGSPGASDNGAWTASNFNTINNVIVANKSTVTGSITTAALVRWLGQKGDGPDIKYTMTGGVLTVTQFTAGTNPTQINPNVVVQCTLAGCTQPIKIIAQLTGTGGATCPDATCTGGIGTYSVTSTDTVNNTSATARVSNFNGTITSLNSSGNYFDPTGAFAAYNGDVANTWMGTITSTGNVNMVTGNSCNYGGSC